MDGARPGRWWGTMAALVALAAATELAMGRAVVCRCGRIAIWAGDVRSAENSQQLLDWYSLTHVLHGVLFYAATWALLRRRPVTLRLTLAVAMEAAWEVLENSPVIIDRYRAATIAIGYRGDSVLNSVGDIGCMIVGFALARRLPVAVTVALAIGFEVLMLAVIRDNLTLNILMLVAPSDAVRMWQAGG